jgi:hydrogenase maturation protease
VNHEVAKKVADAVLYEGYMLYPYRPSAVKNRQRWTFGILYPPEYAEVRAATERCQMHSECLLEISEAGAVLGLQLRFLHLLSRQVAKLPDDSRLRDCEIEDCRVEECEPVPSLLVDDHRIESWDEGVERSVLLELSLESSPQQLQFRFDGSNETEWLRDSAGRLAGIVRRTQQAVTGTVSISQQKIRDGLLKLTVDITNTTSFAGDLGDRNSALLRSLLSAHTILSVNGAQFVSLLDPPEALRDAVSACSNIGNFPVLVGVPPEHDMLLCSPIILYDYPQIAPESAADFCDATEMDEMLTLRVMTLTDEEKDEMRLVDDHFRNLLQCTEQSAREQLTRTHGTIRSLRPVSDKP